MQKKAQAAMEFIMTYGWAILVVLAAVGALAYFGVLSPDRFLPERCTFPPGLDCLDKATISGSANTVQLALRNNIGYQMNVTGVATTDDCTFSSFSTDDTDDVMDNNQQFILTVTCSSISAGRFKSDVTVTYVNVETGLSHPMTGSIRGSASS